MTAETDDFDQVVDDDLDIPPVLRAQVRALNMSIQIVRRRAEQLAKTNGTTPEVAQRVGRLQVTIAALDELRMEIDVRLFRKGARV